VKKIIKILVMLILSVLLSLVIFYKTTNDGLVSKIFGYGVLMVNSGSMQTELQIGDIIVIKECESYEINDIITYKVNDEYLVTHRIVGRNGRNFVTKGDNNNTIDSEIVTNEDIEGKIIYKSKLLKFLYNHWVISVLAIFLALILW